MSLLPNKLKSVLKFHLVIFGLLNQVRIFTSCHINLLDLVKMILIQFVTVFFGFLDQGKIFPSNYNISLLNFVKIILIQFVTLFAQF